jgi:hypothetical protein
LTTLTRGEFSLSMLAHRQIEMSGKCITETEHAMVVDILSPFMWFSLISLSFHLEPQRESKINATYIV